jgi:hypothetical protein
MKPKCVTETVHVVEVNDLETFIREQTGHSYEVVPNEEWGNDEQHRFDIDGKLDEWNINDWNEFKSDGVEHQYRTRTIMNGLCADGKLDAGIYVINVSW